MAWRKILLSLGLGKHRDLLALSGPTLEHFADRHGYELVIPTRDPAPERRHKQWAKVALVDEYLPACDLLCWIDADAAVVDHSKDLVDDLPDESFLGLVEHRYGSQAVPNTGVMVIRSCRSSRRFFEKVWSMTQFLETRWHDNAAVLELLGYRFDMESSPPRCGPGRSTRWLRNTFFLDREWNSIPEDTATRPRIVHATGSLAFEERFAWLAAAIGGGVEGRAEGPGQLAWREG